MRVQAKRLGRKELGLLSRISTLQGDLLLFTDADTQYNFQVLKLAEYYLWLQQADAVTVIPRFLCIDLWTKITLPMLSVFLHTRLSALRVNNPRTKTGYFFGSFYLITRSSYEAGTHKIVKHARRGRCSRS